MKRLGYVILLFGLFYGVEGRARVDPLVDTKVGRIKGLVATDGDYSMFLGIPYATVDPLNPFGVSVQDIFYFPYRSSLFALLLCGI